MSVAKAAGSTLCTQCLRGKQPQPDGAQAPPSAAPELLRGFAEDRRCVDENPQARSSQCHESKRRKKVEPAGEGQSSRQSASPPPPELVEGHEEYVVERISAHRKHRGVPQWFVIWKGYDESQGTWETYDQINNGGGQCELWIDYEATATWQWHQAT